MASKVSSDTAFFKAVMDVAAQLGWRKARLSDLADATGLDLAALHEKYRGKQAILAGFVDHIDRQMLATAEKSKDLESSPRDRLFDLLMHRFDTLNQYRDGVRSIVRDGGGGGLVDLLCSGQRMVRSMAWVMEAADIDTTGFAGRLRVKGLAAVYVATVNAWLRDESEDMSKTMAALDRNLARAERFASIRAPRWRRPGATADDMAGAGTADGLGPESPEPAR